jgi:hypothetical protein
MIKECSNIKTYLDESGNTGKNLLDANQPFFTLGAVLIDDSNLSEVENRFSSIPVNLRDEQGEIKGNNIVYYDEVLALELVAEFLPQCANMFFFSVLEKKFMIAAQIVDNYFDYVYNDQTDVTWTYKNSKKIDLANFFYDKLSIETLTNAHNAFLSKSIQQINFSFNQITNEIKEVKNDFDVASLMNGAEKHLQPLTDNLTAVNKKHTLARGVPKNTLSTPNVTTYFELIGRIEIYLAEKELPSILIFDNSEQYNIIFKELLDKMIKAPRKKIAISESEFLQFGFTHLIEYRIEESNLSVGLQFADILSSTVNHVFTKILLKKDEDLTQEDILLTSFVYLFSTNSPSGYWTVSKAICKRIGEIITQIR